MKTNKKMTRIVTGIFFLSFISLVSFAQGPRGERGNMSAEQRAKMQTERMVEKLALDDEQATHIEAINLKYASKMEDMRSGDQRPDHETMKAMREKQQSEYAEVLTEDQMVQLEEMKKERGKKRRGRGRRK